MPFGRAPWAASRCSLTGHIFVGWGVHAWFTEFEPDGTAVLDGNLAASATQSYRAFRSPWTGRPADPPGVAVKLTNEGMTVFAAWNGATEVSRGAVLAGNDRSRRRTVRVEAKNGFETAIAVGARMRYVAVPPSTLAATYWGYRRP